MADPQFPLLPLIADNPIDNDTQAFILARAAQLYPQRNQDDPKHQLSQIYVIFRDGFVLPFSALDLSGKPIARNYDLPASLGTVTASTQVAFVSTLNAEAPAASGWMVIGGKHYCTGG